jgi:hypothetical protein
MAETKSKKQPASKSAGSSTKPKAKSQKPKSQSKSKAKPKAAKSKSAKPKAAKKAKPKSSSKSSSSKSKSPSSNGSRSSGGSSPVEAVRNAVGGVGDKAKSAGQGVGKVASKAKVPLVAGGAAVAGAAGGMALAAASKQGRKKGMKSLKAAMPRKPKVKIKSKDLAKAAKEVGKVSAQVSEIANGIQRAQDSSSNGDGKHRSPVEVVLQGLTARR